MNKRLTSAILLIALSLYALLVHCGGSNRLREYYFMNKATAAIMAVPPKPEVFTDHPAFLEEVDPVGTDDEIGTSVAKDIQVVKTQASLDSAMTTVNIPLRIKNNAFEKCALFLHYRSIEKAENAAFLFDFIIGSYGIEAKSWEASVFYKIDITVNLLDNKRGTRIWSTHVNERYPIHFDLGGDILSAISLSELSAEDMQKVFKHLADVIADRILRNLQRDLERARS